MTFKGMDLPCTHELCNWMVLGLTNLCILGACDSPEVVLMLRAIAVFESAYKTKTAQRSSQR